ncbi:hypothetical protein HPDFL43_00035970 [Hoeflea phototrophica DFL-43]|uniref:Uncharacterized protein n=1 Tax=Hoeflea phototrophica (strain DSM 17068 / NCIMB 14078 / DFL-43) TaxID=411684 RepID=A0A094YYJ8_HOEPD|nr:hypothetical protein HPDFL43_00035970 [Hoeflea phototrophica DFL-43]
MRMAMMVVEQVSDILVGMAMHGDFRLMLSYNLQDVQRLVGNTACTCGRDYADHQRNGQYGSQEGFCMPAHSDLSNHRSRLFESHIRQSVSTVEPILAVHSLCSHS